MIVVEFIYKYLYFTSGLYFFALWLISFLYVRESPQSQRKMIVMSIGLAILTPIVAQICLVDWWSPLYIFNNTIFRLEDVLFGFSTGGLVSGLYSMVEGYRKPSIQCSYISMKYKLVVLGIAMAIMFGAFYFLSLSSFYSSVLCMVFLIAATLLKCVKPLWASVLTGLWLLLLAVPGYIIATIIHPNWIQEYWLLTGVPSTLIFTVPLGEYVYYFLSGVSLSLFQELWFYKSAGD